MDEQTTGATPAHPGCPFCSLMPMLEKCWPEASRDHFRNSRIEFLKGLRSLLDESIAHMARQEHKGTRVTVE